MSHQVPLLPLIVLIVLRMSFLFFSGEALTQCNNKGSSLSVPQLLNCTSCSEVLARVCCDRSQVPLPSLLGILLGIPIPTQA